MTARIKLTRRSPVFDFPLICQDCGNPAKRNASVQRFCPDCSAERDRKRKEKYRKENPNNKVLQRRYADGVRSRYVEKGLKNSESERLSLDSIFPDESRMVWVRRIAIPYSQCLSKNAIWSRGQGGHVFIREQANQAREGLATLVSHSVQGVDVVQNKLWIDIIVQKPNHRSDATNMLVSICDGIKMGLPLDDRWYSVRRLDWQIIKNDPQILIGIGQESDVNLQACSHCGRLLTYEWFWKTKHSLNGIGRACKDCTRAG